MGEQLSPGMRERDHAEGTTGGSSPKVAQCRVTRPVISGRNANMDDPTRRNILKAGAAAAAMAAMPRVFAQQAGTGGTGEFYEKGPVRIRYEQAG